VDTAEVVVKVRGQRSKTQRGQENFARDAISLYLSEGFQLKLVTNNHHVSGNCWSEVKGQGYSEIKCTLAAETHTSTVVFLDS